MLITNIVAGEDQLKRQCKMFFAIYYFDFREALKKRYDHYRLLNHGDQSLVADDVQKGFQKTFQKKLFEKETERYATACL